jgi:YVTN family beta-propeller protein
MRIKSLEGMRMKAWVLGAAILFAACVVGCGGNSTTVAVTVTGPTGTSPISSTGGYPVPPGGSVPLAATVSGITATTVYWQICLKPSLSTAQPTNCTAASGPAQCALPKVASPLTGYGTITPNGLYTAPNTIPAANTALVVATSCVDATAFGEFQFVIKSQYTVTVTPATATIATGQSFQFNATVQGPTNSGVTWAVCTSTTGSSGLTCSSSGPEGQITGSGLYTAPGTLPSSSVTIQATSVADPTQTATAVVSVVSATPPAISSIDPSIAAAGSYQQDIYITGTNFLSTEEVFVGPSGQAGTAVPTTFLSTTLLRATIPAAQLAAAVPLQVTVQTPDGSLTAPVTQTFTLFATRPALVSELPESVSQLSSSANVALTGGFFSSASQNATSVLFNGAPPSAVTLNGSRQLTVTLPGSALSTEGLFPILVQNAGVASGEGSMAGMNLAVTPTPGFVANGPVASATVGANPTAVAIDKADGIAVVANTGSNSVSLVSLASNTVASTITVGNKPTGVAVDDQLLHPVALVVNSADQTVMAIDITNGSTTPPLSVSISSGPNPALPFAVGVNPMTAQPVPGVTPVVHRALVAYQSSNQATVLDVSEDATGAPSLSVVQTIGSSPVLPYSTGPNPAVAIDPRLNWAIVTPGGSGTIGIVDLGRDPVAGVDVGRAPQVVASLSQSITVQGIGIDPETHDIFLSDPSLSAGRLTVFSALNNSATTINCTSNSVGCPLGPFNAANYGSAAVNPLDDVGVAVAQGNAVVVDLGAGTVLRQVTGVGGSSSPDAVAVDPVLNEAVVANSAQNSVSILSLGSAINPMQIVETSPSTTFTSSSPVTLTVTGSFATGSTVRLDQQPIATTPVAATCNGTICRQLTATIPVGDLASARRFAVDVQAPSLAVSNIEDFTVVQTIPVGNAPVGVAVDPSRDLAVVTNSFDGTASLISLANPGPEAPNSLGPVGPLSYSPVQVGSSPYGVATASRLGLAIVANNGSNNVTAIDETGANTPSTISLCGPTCAGPDGVAVNPDTNTAIVTNTNPGATQSAGSVSTIVLSPLAASSNGTVSVDPDPVAAAIDPYLDYAAIATASQSSSVDIIDLAGQRKVAGITGVLQNPSGMVFDPVNNVFLAADSLQNTISIIDPNTFLQTQVAVGIAPTSLDYNSQTSTLVTLNGPSRTMSIMAYVCPPNSGTPSCIGPQVRSVLGLGGSQSAATVLGPNAVAIDPKFNLATVVDPDNNRLLLVPLPR